MTAKPNLRVDIIWHAFGSERKVAQRIGRLLRLNPDQTATVHKTRSISSESPTFDPAKISYVDAPDYELLVVQQA